MLTPNKMTRVRAALEADGWHCYPATFLAMLDNASKADASMTAAQIARHVVALYHARASGKIDGELGHG